ncbi:MAG: hypothetical protein KAG61_12285 [Bacteriovoracaceae bacterium]|nr:hypothetical protein [Bacteriovoracaceae bacterium]
MKKLKLTFLAILFLSSFAQAKDELPELEAKLWNYIVQSQVSTHKVSRYVGGWPTYFRVSGNPIKVKETNSFLSSQLLVALHEINHSYEMPGMDRVIELSNTALQSYRNDTTITGEPLGTVSYWPIQYTKSGKLKRTFSSTFPYSHIDLLNIPNDFDSSSQAFMWFYLSDQQHDYFDSFVETVGSYVDTGRISEHKNEQRWKERSSGAFLTWVDRERFENPDSRIFGGINDVDCVVNLNILTALGTYQNNIGELPTSAKRGMKQSCSLINKSIHEGTTAKCGVWYDRDSQFYTAYVKAQDSGVKCLEETRELSKKRVLIKSRLLLKKLGRGKYTELAEFLTVIKKMWTPSERNVELNYIIMTLDETLRKRIKVKGDVAYLNSRDSLFTGSPYGIRLDWYSKPFATALTLEALMLP